MSTSSNPSGTPPAIQVKRVRNDSYNFLNLAYEEAKEGNEKDVKDLLATCPDDQKEEFTNNLNGFQKVFKRFLTEDGREIEWECISSPPEDMIKGYETLAEPLCLTNIKELLNKLIVVKLNGGLGTGMGCTGPKSVITVRNEFTFLDMQVQQIVKLNDKYGCRIPLVLMNSFNTHEDTKKVLRKYLHVNLPVYCFNQSQYPRIFKESLRTVAKSVLETDGSWYPPGHGDLYEAFYNSGLLQQLIGEGKEYLFVSNIDNLGAAVDLSILNHLYSHSDKERPEFIMEVTDRTKADVKGGTLIEYGGKLRLLEIAQVPKDHVEDFKSVSKFKVFNTNNLWVQLKAIKRLVESDMLHMEIITNHKQLADGDKVIQLETAIGAAIKCFNHSLGINVPRSRFLPVKKCSDLLLVMSNLYTMCDGTLTMNPKREFSSTPLVQLGHFFKKVKEYLQRFSGIPDIIDLDHLTVAGDVTFGRGVVLRGTVIIIANHGERIDIPYGAILENKIVSGNLRIMDH